MKSQKGYVLVEKSMSGESMLHRWWTSARAQVARWQRLHRQRMQLASLSDEALKDLGLSRADVFEETERPFWNDPMKR